MKNTLLNGLILIKYMEHTSRTIVKATTLWINIDIYTYSYTFLSGLNTAFAILWLVTVSVVTSLLICSVQNAKYNTSCIVILCITQLSNKDKGCQYYVKLHLFSRIYWEFSLWHSNNYSKIGKHGLQVKRLFPTCNSKKINKWSCSVSSEHPDVRVEVRQMDLKRFLPSLCWHNLNVTK